MGNLGRNRGSVEVRSGELEFAAAGGEGFSQTDGRLLLDGGNVRSSSRPVRILGGLLTGEGTVVSNVETESVTSPGLSAGTLQVNGRFTHGTSALLEVELGGSVGCELNDVLAVDGHAVLAGVVGVRLIGDCEPVVGQTYRFMTYTSHEGAFDHVENSCGNTVDGFAIQHEADGVDLVVMQNRARTDVNLDGRTDLRDFALLQVCFGLSPQGRPGCCPGADFDGNTAVDLDDYALLAADLQGP